MAKYRKKPVVIEAFQFKSRPLQFGISERELVGEVPEWFSRALGEGTVEFNAGQDHGYLNVLTLEGKLRAEEGDFIIQGIKGELYPCKPDIFEATYERAD